jgi:hypothetical protein
MSRTMKIGDRVSVDKIRNGYWVGFFKGTILNLKEGKAQIDNGISKRWYSINNVRKVLA